MILCEKYLINQIDWIIWMNILFATPPYCFHFPCIRQTVYGRFCHEAQ